MGFRPLLTTLMAVLMAVALTWPAGAQTGIGGVASGAPPSEGVRALTPFEQFAGRLKLDEKTQVPGAQEIFTAAAKEAAPVAVEMLQLRQKLLNAVLSGSPEDQKAVESAYTATAAKMAGIEAAAFAKVYATLKPNQQSNAPQAFALIAGFFQAAGPSGGGRGQRGGGQQ
jgi:2-hydroxychromene-2-carboxylate isomerase